MKKIGVKDSYEKRIIPTITMGPAVTIAVDMKYNKKMRQSTEEEHKRPFLRVFPVKVRHKWMQKTKSQYWRIWLYMAVRFEGRERHWMGDAFAAIELQAHLSQSLSMAAFT